VSAISRGTRTPQNWKGWQQLRRLCYCEVVVTVLYSVNSDSFETPSGCPVLARSMGTARPETFGA